MYAESKIDTKIFYLWMDLKKSGKVINEGGFYFKVLFQPNRAKNKEMRAKNQKLYNYNF
jgi:hypothetical protein